jgi:hypothetical protein
MYFNHTQIPESFLHFVWKNPYLNIGERLVTNCGKSVEIVQPGVLNHDQGPDFLQARLCIGGVLWHGQVEIHVQSRSWYTHQHDKDSGYNGVVLHVVLTSGTTPIIREDGTEIPEIAIGDHIPEDIFTSYHTLLLNENKLACAGQWDAVPEIIRKGWFARLAVERIERKAESLALSLKHGKDNWNQTMWEALAGYMGGPVNKEAFRAIAKTIPIGLFNRYRGNYIQQEALLFGCAGLLKTAKPHQDTYYQQLKREWKHLCVKHTLDDNVIIPLKFHRMRPASFPTIRLSQLASLSRHWPQLTSLLGSDGIKELFDIPILASQYWNEHYMFGKESNKRDKCLGKTHKAALVINILAPFSLIFQRAHHGIVSSTWLEDTLNILEAEKNRHTRLFMNMGSPPSNAIDSQGMIECYTAYCIQKRCLDWAIGHSLLK